MPRSLISPKVKIPPVLFTRNLFEKGLFEQLCETDGITPSKAIQSFILACNERGAIGELEIQDARYMARYGISQMR